MGRGKTEDSSWDVGRVGIGGCNQQESLHGRQKPMEFYGREISFQF